MMDKNGLTKLVEECGELAQICAKKMAFMETDVHPDGGPSLKERMENEIADVFAAAALVVETFNLDIDHIETRTQIKLDKLKYWHQTESKG